MTFRDDGRYEVSCPEGHHFVTLLQEQKFEVLFQIGAHAMLDGYYREAVASFTSSLERFYEFAIRCFLLDNKVADPQTDKAWKYLPRSERQLGAFVALWAYRFGETPELLREDDTHLRNEVIHDGRIPTWEQALSYGDRILHLARPQMRRLQEHLPDAVQALIVRHLQLARASGGEVAEPVFMSLPTPLNLAVAPSADEGRSLQGYLDSLGALRHLGIM